MIRSTKKYLSLAIQIALAISALAPAVVASQHRKRPVRNERWLAIYGMVRQVVRQTNTFEKVLKKSLKTGVYAESGGRKELTDLADNMRSEARQTKADFEAGKTNDAMVDDVGNLFVSAERVNVIAGNVPLGARIGSRWVDLRDALNNLGSAYRLKPLSSVQMLGESEALAVSKARHQKRKTSHHQ